MLNQIKRESFLSLETLNEKSHKRAIKICKCFNTIAVLCMSFPHGFVFFNIVTKLALFEFINYAFKAYFETSYYMAINIITIVEIYIGFSISVFGSLSYIYFVLHSYFQLKILNCRIKYLSTGLEYIRENERIKSEFYQNIIQKRLADCIRHHAVIIR